MPRILIIDDEVSLAHMLRDWMLAQEDYQVVLAHDGLQGDMLLNNEQFNVAIVDWDLPGKKGPDIVRQFRNNGGTTPILLLTGRTTEDDKETGLDAGADDYLTKPFSIKELGARIRSLLRRAGSPVASSTDSGGTNTSSSLRVCPSCGKQYKHSLESEICEIDGATTVPVSDKEVIGKVLCSNYEAQELLGVGAWSEVYKARDLRNGQPVAVKLMHTHLTADPVKVERFRREADAIAKVQHEALANIISQGCLPTGRPFLIMDYIEGVSLERYLTDNGRLTVDQVRQALLPVCRALGKAHAAGLIHRDLKPSNITLTKQNGLYTGKLLDFGLAKIVMHDSGAMASLTASGEVLGTPAYMSPEQCLGAPMDHRSDLYALGCILYEVLTGRRAVVGRTSYEAMSNHIGRYPDSMQLVCAAAKVPPAIEEIIFKLMAKDPDDRFATADEFVESFERLAARR